MGAAQSVSYPGEQSSNAIDNNLPIINLRETPMPTFQYGNISSNTPLQLHRSIAMKKKRSKFSL